MPKLKITKIESCQNWSCQNWKLPKLKIAKIAKIKNCQNWKLLKIGNCQCSKLTNCQNWKLTSCQNWKLPKLKIAKLLNCQFISLRSWSEVTSFWFFILWRLFHEMLLMLLYWVLRRLKLWRSCTRGNTYVFKPKLHKNSIYGLKNKFLSLPLSDFFIQRFFN